MPIVEIPAVASPLTQGDILRDIRLFETAADWSAKMPEHTILELCLVVSRPCVLQNKTKFVVVGVEKYKEEKISDIKTFGDIKEFLKQVRDGEGTPDCFYLGQLGGEFKGRHRAKLDAFFTVRFDETAVPNVLQKHRIGRLSQDFSRDLHIRLFQSFASLGFDDVSWYSTDDLRWMVSIGDKEISEAEVAYTSKLAEGEKKGLEEIARKIKQRREEIEIFRAELNKRGQ